MTNTTSTGGFSGSPLEALAAPATTSGCCGGTVASRTPDASSASAGGCCGTAAPAQSATTTASGCCG